MFYVLELSSKSKSKSMLMRFIVQEKGVEQLGK